MSATGFSIIICCYNSSTRLPETLRHIAALDTKGLEVEVIVVDNASKDNTADAAKSEWASHPSAISFQVVHQPIPGLAAARNMGVATSRHELLLFCDDDNWLDRGFLQHSAARLRQLPNVAILGGISEAVCETTPPHWFQRIGEAYAVGRQGSATGRAWVLWGAGMVLRKSALLELEAAGFTNLLSDRKGNNLTSGGDHELCWAIRLMGYDLWFDEELRLQHFVPKERLTESYLRRLFCSTAYCVLGLQPYQSIIERDIQSVAEINRFIFFRKSIRQLVEVAKAILNFELLRAIASDDLPTKLRIARSLRMAWIYATSTGELMDNTRRVLDLRGRVFSRRTASTTNASTSQPCLQSPSSPLVSIN